MATTWILYLTWALIDTRLWQTDRQTELPQLVRA